MRFMMLMIPSGSEKTAAGTMPTAAMVAAMTKYNEALAKAGVLLALDGGYWMIQVRSKDEAVAWASRCPALDGDVIEVRQVQEMEDFPGVDTRKGE